MIDCHTHTRNSPDAPQDAGNNPAALCKKAIAMGIKVLAITEHCDLGDAETYKTLNIEKFMQENTAVKKTYGGISADGFTFVAGIELGQITQEPERAEEIAADPRLDFILASVHALPGRQDFYWIDYSKENISELLQAYFEEILKLCSTGTFDVLAHLTYCLRYIEIRHGILVDISQYDGIIEEIFKSLIRRGKGLEINTSGLWAKFGEKYGKTLPEYRHIKLYKDLGGEIISVGSDSHCITDLGKGIPEGIELAKKAGFKYLAYYQKRKVCYLPIDG
ncbi:MAG: histidinol-phosphatase HisJ family protein [Oscillospiraceae bacterium]|jgi:histidinol-phosphatase (PHP family)|nr:histidinol-phosphatase HisJ family protein [Oscillospiraceae bacterium]